MSLLVLQLWFAVCLNLKRLRLRSWCAGGDLLFGYTIRSHSGCDLRLPPYRQRSQCRLQPRSSLGFVSLYHQDLCEALGGASCHPEAPRIGIVPRDVV